jgi:hypothetical protein
MEKYGVNLAIRRPEKQSRKLWAASACTRPAILAHVMSLLLLLLLL